MKRLILLPVLLLGLSFACDQPYEELAGIKIGCPIENEEGYTKEVLLEEVDENGEVIVSIYSYVDNRNADLFMSDRNKILTINGVVEYVQINNIIDPKKLTEELDAKWENQIKKNECDVWGMSREDRYSDYCNSPERAISVWLPSDSVLHKIKLNFSVRSFQLTAISQLYQDLLSVNTKNGEKEESPILDIIEKKDIPLPLL